MTETLLISSGNGPRECRRAVAHLLSVLEDAAGQAGVSLDMAVRAGDGDPSSVVLRVSGPGAGAFAAHWVGPVLWRCASPFRPRHRRKSWFIEVFRVPPVRATVGITPAEVRFQTIRAGGPGGQHVNTTDSAVRARWVGPEGQVYHVLARDGRSQHQNRKAALDRLSALVAADRAEAQGAQRALV
ncbi:MAG: peptide chain release factor-like protein, partial [Pseudomonadota bacterium]